MTQDGTSLFWAGLNKGKRSIAVDMAHPEGQEIVTRLITAPGPDAGMFLTNLRVRGWMDYPALSAHRPDLIMVSLTGTRRGEPAVDYTVNPALGFPMATGPEGSTEPVAHVLPAWDCIAGGMVVQALLAAERHRLRTGEGQVAELSLKDVAAAMVANLGILGEVAINGVSRAKSGNSLYGAYGQDFPCRCGARVMVIGLTDRQWRGLVKTLGMEQAIADLAGRMGLDLRQEGNRWLARKEITAVFQPWFAARDLSEIGPMFDAAGLTWAPFRDFAGAVQDDSDLSPENPMFSMLHQPGIGTLPVPGSPIAFSAIQREAPVAAPRLGQHSEEILGDVLGLGDGEIGRLMDARVVAQG